MNHSNHQVGSAKNNASVSLWILCRGCTDYVEPPHQPFPYFLLPHNEAQFADLFWALFFVKIYVKEKVTCGAASGGQGGTIKINPMILRKHIWLMITYICYLLLYLMNGFKYHNI
jgi:hypothetical protein